jgi:hypothetical protein
VGWVYTKSAGRRGTECLAGLEWGAKSKAAPGGSVKTVGPDVFKGCLHDWAGSATIQSLKCELIRGDP